MAGYRKLSTRRLQPEQDVDVQCRIVTAKLREIADKPTTRQKILIEGVVPLIVQLYAWRQEFLETGQLNGKYASVFSNVKTTIQSLTSANKEGDKPQSEEESTEWADLF